MARSYYYSMGAYCQQRFGGPVRKISLAAGFTCPNRDGTLSHTGCIYCEPASYSPWGKSSPPPLIQQLRQGIAQGRQRGINKFIAYFQSHTNTYAPLSQLQAKYAILRDFPEIKALAIGTRPDCVSEEVLNLIASYAEDYEVWIEYGLQSIHADTLQRLNRGHVPEDFYRAVELTRRFSGIKICAHIILGLPGEDKEKEQATATALANLRLEGVKLHPLHVVAGTVLAQQYAQGQYTPLGRSDYVSRVIRFLERLWPQTVIQRLTADCLPEFLIAPTWLLDKSQVLSAIQTQMEKENTYQGHCYQPPG